MKHVSAMSALFVTVLVAGGITFSACAARTSPSPPPSADVVSAQPPQAPQDVTNAELIEAFGRIELEARETEKGVVVFLPSAYLFTFDSYTLSQDALDKLLQVATVLNQARASSRTISVEGHTDSVGADSYNAVLSERRAKAVMDQLAVGNLAAARMTMRGHGKSSPRAPNTNIDGSDNPDGRAVNRRVELVIANPGGV